MKTMLAEHVERPADCAIIACAKKIVRERSAIGHGTVTLSEFERQVAAEVEEITNSVVRQNQADLLGKEARKESEKRRKRFWRFIWRKKQADLLGGPYPEG